MDHTTWASIGARTKLIIVEFLQADPEAVTLTRRLLTILVRLP